MITNKQADLLQTIESQMLSLRRKCEKAFTTSSYDPREADIETMDDDQKMVLRLYHSFSEIKYAATTLLDKYYEAKTDIYDPNQTTIDDYIVKEDTGENIEAIQKEWDRQDAEFMKQLNEIQKEEDGKDEQDDGPAW